LKDFLKMPGDLFPCGAITISKLPGYEFLGLCQKRKNRLIAPLPLVLRVVALTRSHLLAVKRVHGRVSVDCDCSQRDIAGGPHGFSHPPLDSMDLTGNANMQRIQKPPQRALRRQMRNLQYSCQERISGYESQLVKPRKSDINAQDYCQNELVRGHYLGNPCHSQTLFNMLLESNLLEHGGHGK
jgi:hypothetical protein